MRLGRRATCALGTILAGALAVATAAVVAPAGATVQSHTPKGSLTVTYTGAEWPNLDPALDNQDAADSTMLDAIYGQLFEAGPGGSIVPDEASGYTFSNHNETVTITLRHGLTFQDGTPFTASAVAASINRDLIPANGCLCDSDFAAVTSVTASGRYNVVLQLKTPFAAIITAFINTAPNWTVSPSALSKDGAATFGQDPVGAGPFEVVSNTANTELVLKAFPHYWAKGEPYLAHLTFESVGSDQVAYDALQNHQAQIALLVTTIPLIKQAEHASFAQVITFPATFYEFVSLNSTVAPFNNETARLALYYATDAKALVADLYDNVYHVVESPTAPGETIYVPKVAGYPTYNLAKAKQLVSEIPGGLTVTLATTSNTAYWSTEAAALEAMWAQAGIQTKVLVNTLLQTLQQLQSNSWQALLSNWGGVDPAVALPIYFTSTGLFSGIHDPTLDGLINKGAAYVSPATRLKVYTEVAERMASQAEAPFLYSKPTFAIASKSVTGLSDKLIDVNWETVALK